MMGRVLGQQDSLDETSERFFSEGDEHERRGWDDVLPLDEELDPRRRRGSVDKVPRRLGAVLALVTLGMCVALGAAIGGFALFAKGSFRSWFKLSSHEPATMSPPKQPRDESSRTEPQPIAQPPVQPLPQPVEQPRAPTQARAEAPVAAPKPPSVVVPPDLEGAERLRRDSVRKRRQRRHSEDDYVWSQELNALVPAEALERLPVRPNTAPVK
jgi:hypothetical protein